MAAAAKRADGPVEIPAPRIVRTSLRIRGTAPLVQHKFAAKAREQMKQNMATPAAEKKAKTARPPRDYDMDFEQAQHRSEDGGWGIPCAAFRMAMIDACRTVNMQMTRAKMSVWVVPDCFDVDDGTPMVRLLVSPPERLESLVRNDNGNADIRIRPMWRQWEAIITMEFDEEMISAASVVNLLDRAGKQVGVQEGRMYSKDSGGQGWGSFEVVRGE
jgi:hypothetical protein